MSNPETSHGAFRRWARIMLAHRSGTHGIHHDGARARELYQTSTMSALLDGVYDGEVTVGELLRHGDFGLGTFNHLDGEMLVLDGVCHHLRADGSATAAQDDELTPFATVTWFTADADVTVPPATDRSGLTALVDRSVTSENLVYAIRITGTFSEIHTRTVMEQTPPYPRLDEATKGQKETTLRNMSGTLAGFRTPAYEQGISVPGYHLHFLDDDRRHGGHALDFRMEKGRVQLSTQSDLHLSLPRTPQFLASDLSAADTEAQIRKAEGG
jgi:acetolactate decarboxylase